MQRRIPINIHQMIQRPHAQQICRCRRPPEHASRHQRRQPLEIGGVDGDAGLQEDLDDSGVTLPAGPVDGTGSLRAQTGEVDGGGTFHEVAHHLDVAVEGSPVGGGVAPFVAGTQDLAAEFLDDVFHVWYFPKDVVDKS